MRLRQTLPQEYGPPRLGWSGAPAVPTGTRKVAQRPHKTSTFQPPPRMHSGYNRSSIGPQQPPRRYSAAIANPRAPQQHCNPTKIRPIDPSTIGIRMPTALCSLPPAPQRRPTATKRINTPSPEAKAGKKGLDCPNAHATNDSTLPQTWIQRRYHSSATRDNKSDLQRPTATNPVG